MVIDVDRRKEESDRNYFEGTGYARVPTQPNAPIPTFGQVIQTTMDRGLLFFAENKVFYNKHPNNQFGQSKLSTQLSKFGITGLLSVTS